MYTSEILKRDNKIPFCERGLKFFPKKWYQYLRNIISPVICVQLYTHMGTAKAPAGDLLKLNTRRGTKTAFFTPKRNEEHHHTLRGTKTAFFYP